MDNDTQDFYGDNSEDEKEILGYCFYCKDQIYACDKYCLSEGHIYHRECFVLINQELDFTE